MLKIGTIDEVRRRKSARRLSQFGINYLDGLDWIQGSNTLMTFVNGRVRAAFAGGNPRVFKNPTNLTIGRTYRTRGTIYKGNGEQTMFVRASPTINLPDGDQVISIEDTTFSQTFIASATSMFIGLVAIRTDGQYAEISDEDFTLTGG